MSFRALPSPATRASSRLAIAALATAVTLSVVGLGTPAQSAPDAACPAAFPVQSLVKDQPVTGLTVSEGTTPESFTGEVIGVLDNGIMPGLDMIMVRLTSAEIDRVGGIWSGMSGSPVYAADGRLIGAVAYGLAAGPSPVAGVTPAADMQELLSEDTLPAPTAVATKVAIPDRLGERLVRSGDATADEVDSGMSQLKLPFGIAGLGSQKRFDTVARRLDLDGMRMVRVGTTSSSAAAAASDLVAGGNLAASIAYGDITAAAVGTVTAVCGGEVLGFGHPMLWSGPSTLTLHGADALYVQEDPTYAGFKLANIGDPLGTVTEDRMPGILGVGGDLPPTSDVTSTVTSGTRARSGETHISLPLWVPDMAFSHVLANMDRIFDGIGKGSGSLGWTVDGTREDGTPFSLQRDDIYADTSDITFASAWDLYMTLSALEFNGVEDIALDAVDADATLSRSFDRYLIKGVEVRRAGVWVPVESGGMLSFKGGRTKLFRVLLNSPKTGLSPLIIELPIPRRAAGMFGSLEIFGGNTGLFEEETEFFVGGTPGTSQAEPTFDEILARLGAEPGNDDVVANLTFYDEQGGIAIQRHRQSSTGLVVDGGIGAGVLVR